jgi:hypothetical protein
MIRQQQRLCKKLLYLNRGNAIPAACLSMPRGHELQANKYGTTSGKIYHCSISAYIETGTSIGSTANVAG